MATPRRSLADSGPNPFRPPPSTGTTTRSMSRRSLAHAGLPGIKTSEEGSMQPPSRTATSTAARVPRLRTNTDVSSTSSSLSRSRTSSSLSRPTLPSKTATPAPSSTRPRRVLGDHHNTASSSSLNTAGAAMKSPPKRGRLSRAEAGQMTGMGVVRAGPAVQGRGGREALSKATSSSSVATAASDPFSTSFQRPTFDFEMGGVRGAGSAAEQRIRVVKPLPSGEAVESRRRQLSGVAEQDDEDPMDTGNVASFRVPEPTAANPFDLTSPKKRSATVPPRSPLRAGHFVSDENAFMDVDGLAPPPSATYLGIPPSSPVRGALSPRTLTGKTAASSSAATGTVRRKLDEVESSSEEDELDFLSPRKKAKRMALAPPSPVAPAPGPPAFPSRQQQSSGLLRSPPPKKKLPSSASVRASVQAALPTASSRREPTSVAMQRTAGRAFPLPDLTSLPPPPVPVSKLPRSQPLSSLSASTTAPAPITAAPAEPTNRILPPSLTGPTAAPKLARSSRASLSGAARPSALPVSVPTASSGGSSRLPRPAARVVPTASASGTAAAHPPADDSVAFDAPSSTSIADLSTASTSTVTSTKSEETARRLANLQSMLSRLQMPASRRTSGGESSTSMSLSSAPREYEVPIAPPAEAGTARRTSLPRRTSAGLATPAPPSAAGVRRRSSVVARAPGGIVNTSTALGNISISSASAPNLGTSSRRISGPGSASFSHAHSNSSFSFDTSLIAEASGGVEQQGSGKSTALRGVSAFVDVRTAEGDDSSMIFTDMLRSMGARVTTRPSSLTTHIIYKSGRPSTLHFFRTLSPSSRPNLVGIAWVVRCAEVGSRVDEAPFKVDDVEGEKENRAAAKGKGRVSGGEAKTGEKREIGAMAQAALGLSSGPGAKGAGPNKRRRSMEPKALAALNNSMNATASADNALKASIAASIERARRKSLLYAPKVGSPLAKRVFVMPDPAPAEEMDEDE
ncbi:hypothetical protein JCM6882_000683 [Rhodosporidiobolus microsporus]